MFKGLSNLANMGNMLRQAQQMQGRMKDMQQELQHRRAVGSAGDGAISIEVNGLGDVLSCRIESGELDAQKLEAWIPEAIQKAVAAAREMQMQAMQTASGGLDLSQMNEMLSSMGSGG
jgi:DNA-binding YbaB/EbfC family protein